MSRERTEVRAPAMSTLELGRWCWRQLTSMRTALFLLLLLALAAIPGSLVPQTGVDPQKVQLYRDAHPTLAPLWDRLGMFSVYTSVWFSAIYVLLMVSLVGCIIPRLGVYARALRQRPPKAPRNFDRLPASATYETDASPEQILADARTALGRARIDVVLTHREPDVSQGNARRVAVERQGHGGDVVGGELRAETGYLREAGNLVFHCCLVAVLVGVAATGLFGYRGNAIVTEGSGFSNTLTQYDQFSSGALFDEDQLPPFSLRLDAFTATFQKTGPQRGAPRHFEATGSYVPRPGAPEQPFDIQVNHPLRVGGTSVYLVGQGYAPVLRVTDGEGKVAFEGAVPFLPTDATYTSTGVVKVPDARPTELGFQGFFLPTAVSIGGKAPISASPAAANPVVGLFAYDGSLGLDDGRPQSVYTLDKDDLTQLKGAGGRPLRLLLAERQTATLPGGRGTVTYMGTRQFVKLQFSSSPGLAVPLWGTSLGVLGLILSLTIRPRRTWVRTRRSGTRTVVEVAALDRVSRGDIVSGVDVLVERLHDLDRTRGAGGDDPATPTRERDDTMVDRS